ncbi:MAG TPA: regulatory protein RecX [Gemmatimonadales bacterium]|nr:regulatory protein RecX [Gemmatimonadales bacterium]
MELDGREVALPVVALASLGLGAQDPVPPHLHSRVAELARIELTCQSALRALAGRARTRADLRRFLLERDHAPAAVDTALERLAARGWLDDRRFAEEFAVRRARGRGPDRLVLDLLRHGVERSVAEAAVRTALAEAGADVEGEAEALARRRATQLDGLAPAVRKRRLLAYLARRGYRGAPITAVVDALCRTSA